MSPWRFPRDPALSTYGYNVIISPPSLFIPFCEPRGERELFLFWRREMCVFALLFTAKLDRRLWVWRNCDDGQMEWFAQDCLIPPQSTFSTRASTDKSVFYAVLCILYVAIYYPNWCFLWRFYTIPFGSWTI